MTIDDRRIDALINEGQWENARQVIEQVLVHRSEDHWLLTQLGVTFYEQGRYRESMRPLLKSLEIVPDCPLTLWNLAGALDAIGKPEPAIQIYTWLFKSRKSASDDPCWESAEWTNALKADCVYRLGVCFQHLKQWEPSERCFRQYINSFLDGSNGTYTIEQAARHIRERHSNGSHAIGQDVRNEVDSILHDTGIPQLQGRRRKLPKLSAEELLAT